MQRKDIKVGGVYAVARRMLRRGYRLNREVLVRATVVSMTETVRARGYHGGTSNIGIRIRFDEPMILGSDTFLPAKKSKSTVEPITEFVLPDGGGIRLLWDEHVAQRTAQAEATERHEREADAMAVAFKPYLEATLAALTEHGITGVGIHNDLSAIFFDGGSIALAKRPGSDGQKVTGFGGWVRIDSATMLGLLGVEVPDDT